MRSVQLSGALNDVNSSDTPQKVVPKAREQPAGDAISRTFPPHSVTILRFE